MIFNIGPAAAAQSAPRRPRSLAGALGYALLPPCRSWHLGALYLPAVAVLAVGAMISAPRGSLAIGSRPALPGPSRCCSSPPRCVISNPLGPRQKASHSARAWAVAASGRRLPGHRGARTGAQSDDLKATRRDRRCVGLTARRSEAHCAGPPRRQAPSVPEPPAPPAPRREPARWPNPYMPAPGKVHALDVPSHDQGKGRPRGCQLAGAAQRLSEEGILFRLAQASTLHRSELAAPEGLRKPSPVSGR